MAVSQATDNVFVGILHGSAGQAAGFFPFQVVRPGFGKNLEMCDYQGVIAPAGLEFNAKDLVKGCGLKVWEFDHLILANRTFRRFYSYTAESPIIDVRQGFDAYKASLSPEGKRHLAKATTSARKAEREIGSLRLVFHNSADSEVMQTMHRWRAQKYGPLPDWAHFALETIRTINTPAFAGVLSALFAGEKLLAVRFGVRTGTVLHWWLPAYNPDLPSYAPGILLLLAMAERGPDLGITRIDLGKGLQDYKRKISQCFRHGGHRLGGCALLQHGAEDPPPDLSQLHSQHPPTAASGPPGKASALPDPANLRLIFRCAFSMSIPQPRAGGTAPGIGPGECHTASGPHRFDGHSRKSGTAPARPRYSTRPPIAISGPGSVIVCSRTCRPATGSPVAWAARGVRCE